MENKNLPKEITDTNASAKVNACLARIEKERNNVCSTGFTNLDKILAGGLRSGRLYMIGAINSLGKTTFVLNIADNVANVCFEGRGKEVLIYSLEASSDELILKSLIRRLNLRNCQNPAAALRYADIVLDEDPLSHIQGGIMFSLKSCAKNYSDNIGKNIYIQDGRDICDQNLDALSHLESYLEKFSKYNHRAPLVVIDYLELLPSHSVGYFSDKQIAEENVCNLKWIAMKYDVPVIVVSSFNVNNYINCGADVVLGLQLATATSISESREFRTAVPAVCHKEIELKIIKDKMFEFYETIRFNYYPQYDYFEQVNL
jgi:replicative DNA helicase